MSESSNDGVGKKEKKMDKYKKMYNSLSDDLKKKATECKNAEELMELAKTEGIELTDEQMDAISGGFDWSCDDFYLEVNP